MFVIREKIMLTLYIETPKSRWRELYNVGGLTDDRLNNALLDGKEEEEEKERRKVLIIRQK
jgi:hypothetical protein